MGKMYYELMGQDSCVTVCPFIPGMMVGSIFCVVDCSHNIFHNRLNKFIDCDLFIEQEEFDFEGEENGQ
jgi:hypothetical protein